MSDEVEAREKQWASWMRAALDGDSEAYRYFLVAVAPYLRAMTKHRCDQFGAQAVEVEDIVQEVLLAVHMKRGTWDRTRPIGPWLSAIVRNKLIDSLRRRNRHAWLPIEDFMTTLVAEDDRHEAAMDRLDAERALASLKPQQRAIVRSISIDGSGVRETAEQLGMSEGAVRVALHRALKFLSARYGSK